MLIYLLAITPEEQRSKVEYLYNTFHDDMIRFARSRFKRAGRGSYETDAEDVVQNAFVKIVKYIDAIDFEGGEARLKAYVFSIVANEITDFQKEMADFADIDDCSELPDDDDFIEQLNVRQDYERLLRLIKAMDEKYSTVLLLKFERDMEVKQIAEILGVCEKTVYTRLARAKVQLLRLLEEEKHHV